MKKLLLLTLLTFNAYAVDPLIEPTSTVLCTMSVEREDGTPLPVSEIAEVMLYMGTTSGVYTIDQVSPTCEFTIDNQSLANGDYYFVLTTIDTDGRQSNYSEERIHKVKRVAPPMPPVWVN